MLNNFTLESLEADIQLLVMKIKNEKNSQEDRLKALQDLNSLLEAGIEYVNSLKENII